MKFKDLKTTALNILVAFSLSACGFHLRANTPSLTPLSPVCIDAAPNIKPLVIHALHDANAKLTQDPKSAKLHLTILRAEMQKPRAYLNSGYRSESIPLSYHLVVQVKNRLGTRLPPRHIVLTEAMTIGRNQALETDSQTQQIQRQLEVRAMDTLLTYLQSKSVQNLVNQHA